jgi:hypothetical protein
VEQVQTTFERGVNTLMCFYREADNHGGTSVCLHRSRAQTLTPLHANQPGGFFPHGFRGLSLLKVFCPSSNFQVTHRVMLSCTCAQPIRIQVKNRCCSQAPHKKVLFSTLMLLTLSFWHPTWEPHAYFEGGSSLPLVLLQTLAHL